MKGRLYDMAQIYLCDDDPTWLKRMAAAVHCYQVQSDWELTIACQALSPSKLLTCLEQNATKHGIYLLDMDYKTSMNGIALGARIRELDPDASLIFVTTHDEMMAETFRYKLMALDYIMKDLADFSKQISDTLHCIEQRNRKDTTRLYIHVDTSHYLLARDEIYYIETQKGTHRLNIHTATELLSVRRSLREMEAELGDGFFCYRRGCLVNLSHIKKVDIASKSLLLDNGITILCSTRAYLSLSSALRG